MGDYLVVIMGTVWWVDHLKVSFCGLVFLTCHCSELSSWTLDITNQRHEADHTLLERGTRNSCSMRPLRLSNWMTPLELEIYHPMCNVNIDPAFYEYILMVDADTVRYSLIACPCTGFFLQSAECDSGFLKPTRCLLCWWLPHHRDLWWNQTR